MFKFLFLITNLYFTVLSQTTSEVPTPPGVYVDNVCICVPTGHCANKSSVNNNPDIEESDGSLDSRNFRFDTTTTRRNFQVSFPRNNIFPVTTGNVPVIRNQTSCTAGLELCCPSKSFGCGVRYPPVANAPKPKESSQSEYGAYPWDAAILSNAYNEYIGAGALIDHRHVVTVAHKVYKAIDIKCRFGEWNMNSNFEPLPPQEVDVDDEDIIIHPEFRSLRTLRNNIAILRLNAPGVQLGLYPTITSICLPSSPITDMRCWVAGWGKSNFNSTSFQTVLKEVSMPLIEHFTCQSQLRNTRLGPNFILDPLSFICAGGEFNKDACTGDGGAALACEVNGRFYLAGLVAWGIGCGNRDVPGVYTNIYNFIPWIQSIVSKTPDLKSDFTTAASTARAVAASVATTRPSAVTQATNDDEVKTTSSLDDDDDDENNVSGSIAANATTKPAAATTATTKPAVTQATTKATAPAATTKPAAAAATTKPSGNTTRAGNTTVKAGVTTVRSVTTVKGAATTKPTVKGAATTKPTVKGAVTTKPTVKGATTTKPTVKGAATTKPTVKRAVTTKPTVKRAAATTKPTVRGQTTAKAPKPSG